MLAEATHSQRHLCGESNSKLIHHSPAIAEAKAGQYSNIHTMNISEQIDDFIRTEGKGNARDAVNVALTKIELLETQIADLKRLNEEMAKAIFEDEGLSTRQTFAAMAMQGFCSNPNILKGSWMESKFAICEMAEEVANIMASRLKSN